MNFNLDHFCLKLTDCKNSTLGNENGEKRKFKGVKLACMPSPERHTINLSDEDLKTFCYCMYILGDKN